jgi:hypothetical protein
MTLAMMTNAGKYDWPTWMLGIMRAFLSGGASALMTGAGGAVIGIPGKQVWILMGVNFVLMGLYRLGEFLQLHGAPDQLQASLERASVATKEAAQAVAEAKTQTPENHKV